MKSKIRWLRVAYWTAALADFIVALRVLAPANMGVTEYVYPMGLMSAVAASWGVMLLVADRRPVERRWMLLPTILVVFLLGAVATHAGVTSVLPLSRSMPPALGSVIVLAILTFAYANSRNVETPRVQTEACAPQPADDAG